MNEHNKPDVFHGACPHDCPDTCAMEYHVRDGKLVDVRGKKNHPFTRGGLCVKLKDFHDHHANPDRLISAAARRREGQRPQWRQQFRAHHLG